MSIRPVATVAPTTEVLQRLRAQADPEARVRLRPFPVLPELAGLLPDGGLKPGGAYSVAAGSLLMSLLAPPSRDGAWCAVVGMPDLGVEAAAQAGVVLDRLALVPAPGGHWLSVVAALTEVLSVVAVRPPARVGEADAARLAARLRDRGAVLLVDGDWPRTEATLSLGEPHWDGVGDGHGYLTSREVVVSVATRRSPAPRSVRVLLPGPAGRLSAAAPAEPVTRLRAVG